MTFVDFVFGKLKRTIRHLKQLVIEVESLIIALASCSKKVRELKGSAGGAAPADPGAASQNGASASADCTCRTRSALPEAAQSSLRPLG